MKGGRLYLLYSGGGMSPTKPCASVSPVKLNQTPKLIAIVCADLFIRIPLLTLLLNSCPLSQHTATASFHILQSYIRRCERELE